MTDSPMRTIHIDGIGCWDVPDEVLKPLLDFLDSLKKAAMAGRLNSIIYAPVLDGHIIPRLTSVPQTSYIPLIKIVRQYYSVDLRTSKKMVDDKNLPPLKETLALAMAREAAMEGITIEVDTLLDKLAKL